MVLVAVVVGTAVAGIAEAVLVAVAVAVVVGTAVAVADSVREVAKCRLLSYASARTVKAFGADS